MSVNLVSDITAYYSGYGYVKPVIQAAIFEIVTTDVNSIQMSDDVATAYGIQKRNFVYSNMLYNSGQGVNQWGSGASVPDISRIETQMWFYFLATEYLKRGIEAIHFGQIEIMDDNDPYHIFTWDLLSKIRAFASVRNRGLVLCDAHTKGLYNGFSQQLLFDFHSFPLGIQEIAGSSWGGNNGGVAKLGGSYCNEIYGQSKGGQTTFGWQCVSLPFLVEFDNYGISANPNHEGTPCYPWGWDEITWFALQAESYRNDWLKYAYYKVKCLDRNGFLEMPGRRGITEAGVSYPGHTYRAAMGAPPVHYNQATLIQSIWNGSFNVNEWVHHNFTVEEVFNAPVPAHVRSGLVFVGTDKIYYISTDNRVHGYVKYNGTWLTVSPSWSANTNGQPISAQVQTDGDLTASPDGTTLYYRGTDGFIYRYTINDLWSYNYSAMPTNGSMSQQGIRAYSSLVCVNNDLIYYVANELSGNKKRVHGFIRDNGNWVTVSPSWSANSNGQNINSQIQVGGNIAVSADQQNIYYIGTDGLVYKYFVNNIWSYTYSAMPTNSSMISQGILASKSLITSGNNRIYYIGLETATGTYRIHGFIKYLGNWLTVSPSWSANSNGQNILTQTQASSDLTINATSTQLAYIGTDNQLHGYPIIDDWNYTYSNFHPVQQGNLATSDLKFRNTNELYFVSSSTYLATDKKIHRYSFESANCGNPAINVIEPYFVYGNIRKKGFIAEEKPKEDFSENMDGSLKLYPNPAKETITIAFSSKELLNTIEIYDLSGRMLKGQNVGSNLVQMDLNGLAKGVYIMKMISGSSQVMIRKFVVMK